MQAFVISRIDYCNAILYGLPAIHVNRLQRVQNAAARLLTNTPLYSHITPVMINLHWLPVKFRIIFKVNLLTFKALHGLAPAYLSDISFKGDSNHNLRSNFSNLLARPVIRSAKTTGDRVFSVAAPFLWNSLPENLGAISSVNIFKQLKTYLFKQVYCQLCGHFWTMYYIDFLSLLNLLLNIILFPFCNLTIIFPAVSLEIF